MYLAKNTSEAHFSGPICKNLYTLAMVVHHKYESDIIVRRNQMISLSLIMISLNACNTPTPLIPTILSTFVEFIGCCVQLVNSHKFHLLGLIGHAFAVCIHTENQLAVTLLFYVRFPLLRNSLPQYYAHVVYAYKNKLPLTGAKIKLRCILTCRQ